jgi:hypothetical protein
MVVVVARRLELLELVELELEVEERTLEDMLK